MHTDPDDNPVLNQNTKIYFDLKDSSGLFNPNNCDCFLSVQKSNALIVNRKIVLVKQSDGFSAENDFVFTQPGAYKVTLTGQPILNNSFQKFNISYDQSISGDRATPTTPSHELTQAGHDMPTGPEGHTGKEIHTGHFVIFGLGFLVIFYVIWDGKRKERQELTNRE
ncbi:MAG: hypothetical protein NVS3B9_2140 [Candidatus Doudnabacteria bacterium]